MGGTGDHRRRRSRWRRRRRRGADTDAADVAVRPGVADPALITRRRRLGRRARRHRLPRRRPRQHRAPTRRRWWPTGSAVVDVNANQANPNTFATGGVAEFAIADPVVALQGSGTADAPHLVLTLATTGFVDVAVAYDVRDIDGSADNAVQQVALQYRVGTTGDFTQPARRIHRRRHHRPEPATQVDPGRRRRCRRPPTTSRSSRSASSPPTRPAADEWVGIDNIAVTGTPGGGGPAEPVASCPAALTTVVRHGGIGARLGDRRRQRHRLDRHHVRAGQRDHPGAGGTRRGDARRRRDHGCRHLPGDDHVRHRRRPAADGELHGDGVRPADHADLRRPGRRAGKPARRPGRDRRGRRHVAVHQPWTLPDGFFVQEEDADADDDPATVRGAVRVLPRLVPDGRQPATSCGSAVRSTSSSA